MPRGVTSMNSERARAGELTSESAPPMSMVGEAPGFTPANGGAMVTATRTLGPVCGWARSWGTISQPQVAEASSLVIDLAQVVLANFGV